MTKGATKDMTVGSPMKLILGFSVPLLFGFLFQQFYNVVDTIIVGRFLGMEALAGVGATGSVNFLILGFCMGLCSGFAIPVAHKFGAKDYSGMRQVIANCMWLCIGFSVVFTLIVSLLCKQILIWMQTPEDMFTYSYTYILIIFLGIPATILYNMLSGIIRSMGDSKTPLFFLVISSLLNIGLDLLFILNFQMGVAGAAVATVSSQLISGILCLVYMIKRYEILHITGEEWKINFQYMKMLCSAGLPMGLQYSITAIGSVILQAAVNTLGSVAVAAITAGGKVCIFLGCAFDAMGTTMATYAGQNVGAEKLDRLNKGLRDCLLLGAVYSVFSFSTIYFFGMDLVSLFVDQPDAQMLAYAKMYLLIVSATHMLLAIVNIVRYTIQGMGFSGLAIFAGVFEMIARIVVAWIFVPKWGYLGACFANPMAWIMADAFLIPAYFYAKRKLQKRFESNKRKAC